MKLARIANKYNASILKIEIVVVDELYPIKYSFEH